MTALDPGEEVSDCSAARRRRRRSALDPALPSIDLFLNPDRGGERAQVQAEQKAKFQQTFGAMDSVGSFRIGLFCSKSDCLWIKHKLVNQATKPIKKYDDFDGNCLYHQTSFQ